MVRLIFYTLIQIQRFSHLELDTCKTLVKTFIKKFSVVGGAFTMCKILYMAFQEIGMLGICQVFVGKRKN
jgi:hypothetical protein